MTKDAQGGYYPTGGHRRSRSLPFGKEMCALFGPGGEASLVLLKACFDDAGTDDKSEVVTCAGYIAWQKRWNGLDRLWRQTLRSFDVSAFSMKEFAHFDGDFKGWPESKRRAFLNQLLSAITRHVDHGFIVSVYRSDYERHVSPMVRNRVGSAFSFCAQVCMGLLEFNEMNVEERWPHHRVHFLFESGTAKGYQVQRAFDESYTSKSSLHHLRKMAYGSKAALPLQAADLIAYEANKHLRDWLNPPKGTFSPRYPFVTLIREVEHSILHPKMEWLSGAHEMGW